MCIYIMCILFLHWLYAIYVPFLNSVPYECLWESIGSWCSAIKCSRKWAKNIFSCDYEGSEFAYWRVTKKNWFWNKSRIFMVLKTARWKAKIKSITKVIYKCFTVPALFMQRGTLQANENFSQSLRRLINVLEKKYTYFIVRIR